MTIDIETYEVETNALQKFFRKRKTPFSVALQAMINMLVTVVMRREKIGPDQANLKLAAYFRDVGEGRFPPPSHH
jgi:hypothetical protein